MKEFGFTRLTSTINEAGYLRKFCLNLLSNRVCELDWKVPSTQTFEYDIYQ
jgi:hypothetical protein